MSALFIGGIKSGKSYLAEQYALKDAHTKPYYLATTEFIDSEMQERIKQHKLQRTDKFISIEEPLHLTNIITNLEGTVLVECVSMWINNMLYHNFHYEAIHKEMQTLLRLNKNIVFVLNDVGVGVVSENALVREFVDISGKLSQLIAEEVDEVFHVIAGISVQIK